MRGFRSFRGRVTGIGIAVLAVLGMLIAPAIAAPDNTEGDVDTLGLYLVNSRYTGDPNETRGWQITWEVPEVTNVADGPTGAIGQWYFNLESGIYHTADNGWGVYYFSDNNGLEENPAECSDTWDTGGICTEAPLNHLQPGQQVQFTYAWCDENNEPALDGSQLCVWVDLMDGQGQRFLAEDERSTVEMYAHDVETFADSDQLEIALSCETPTRMLGQQVLGTDGTWTTMTGESTWTFEDESDRYTFQNVDTAADPATWESCSE